MVILWKPRVPGDWHHKNVTANSARNVKRQRASLERSICRNNRKFYNCWRYLGDENGIPQDKLYKAS